jgi:hypothetical protein
VIAVASDVPQPVTPPVVALDLTRPDLVASFIAERLPLLDPIELCHDC